MKKESVAKKVLFKSLKGFTVGIPLLMIAYIGLYFIEGEYVFKNEIQQLNDINILISQILVIGITYFLMYIVFYTMPMIQNLETERKHTPYKVIISIILLDSAICTLCIILSSISIFSENIGNINVIILLLAFICTALFYILKRF